MFLKRVKGGSKYNTISDALWGALKPMPYMALFIFHCILVEGRLFYTGPSQKYMRMVVMTERERTAVLMECHDRSNHNGVRGTRNRVVANHITGCGGLCKNYSGIWYSMQSFRCFWPIWEVGVTHTHTDTESCKLTGADIGIQPCPLSIRFYVNWFLI